MKRQLPLFLFLPLLGLVLSAWTVNGLDRHDAPDYGFSIGFPDGWKVEERKLSNGGRLVGEVSFLHHKIKPSTHWTFFKVVATARDSTSSPFKGIADLVGDKGTYREAELDGSPVKILIDEGKTTWLLCDRLFEDFSYSFSFRIQGKLDTDSWLGIKMVLGTFRRPE